MLKRLDKILDQGTLEEFKTSPNQGILWEIIEQQKTGKIFKLPSEAIVVMENCPDPFVFIAGDLTDEDVTEEIIDSVTMPVELCAGRLKGTVATKVSSRSMMAERLHDNAVPLFQSDDWHMENPARTKGEESAVANA